MYKEVQSRPEVSNVDTDERIDLEGGILMLRAAQKSQAAGFPALAGKLLVRPEEGAEILSVSRSRLYELMAAGTIRSIKVRGSRRIPMQELERFVAEEVEAQCA